MKEDRERIDRLLEKNAAEQLADVDWEQLNTAISGRLDQVGRVGVSTIRFPFVLKAAAGFAALAAVILIAVAVMTDEPSDLQLPKGSSAIVKLLEPAGSASVVIEPRAAERTVCVEIGRTGQEMAKCDVKIIDVNGDMEKNGGRAAWIIISKPEPVYADNGASRDLTDLLCLF
jgi:hypothetical protein